ncbi:MAG: lysophospholipid acyltransferase family protein [candidate division KSB1 bacterium]|nr:lysophospholipid acyltransferase family protein [candidate division KSB1 bacterium]MDZ7275720.1 lysophospholipid acyltransferase family protein [candidate division KSB1 bacterium]MDZ7284589.1 lysophospholipid acyltransferase family protein [candidate division KSB1 bacterium]MDZ7297992.1 lysophospholipid acyltransferase family protein [candidate division KSB1 bacterium]MDZ7305840.1 lysophospholipid acyltransferase family protein [candidate division KSB1 bacterium]
MRKLKHLLEYLGLRLLVLLATSMPRNAVLSLGAGLGRFTFSILRIRRRVTLHNLEQAFPEKARVEVLALGRRNYENFGMMLMEYLRLPQLSAEELEELVCFRSAEDEHLWQQTLAEGRGAICMTGHFGNWEYMGAMLAQRFPMVFLYQAQNNPYADRFIRRTRESLGMTSIPRGSALKGILKALREKKFVAVLADQDAGQSGIFVDFLGRPASTARGPAAFVLRSGAPILFVVAVRQPGGHHVIESECLRFDDLPAAWTEEEKIRAVTERWSAVLERRIRRHPDHWFWMHRRWKTAPPAAGQTGRECA